MLCLAYYPNPITASQYYTCKRCCDTEPSKGCGHVCFSAGVVSHLHPWRETFTCHQTSCDQRLRVCQQATVQVLELVQLGPCAFDAVASSGEREGGGGVAFLKNIFSSRYYAGLSLKYPGVREYDPCITATNPKPIMLAFP